MVILLPVKAAGVMGDKRTYEQVIALRVVTSKDFMTADWYAFPPEVSRRVLSRITDEVNSITPLMVYLRSLLPSWSSYDCRRYAMNIHKTIHTIGRYMLT